MLPGKGRQTTDRGCCKCSPDLINTFNVPARRGERAQRGTRKSSKWGQWRMWDDFILLKDCTVWVSTHFHPWVSCGADCHPALGFWNYGNTWCSSWLPLFTGLCCKPPELTWTAWSPSESWRNQVTTGQFATKLETLSQFELLMVLGCPLCPQSRSSPEPRPRKWKCRRQVWWVRETALVGTLPIRHRKPLPELS